MLAIKMGAGEARSLKAVMGRVPPFLQAMVKANGLTFAVGDILFHWLGVFVGPEDEMMRVSLLNFGKISL